jgi:hypothetical protein
LFSVSLLTKQPLRIHSDGIQRVDETFPHRQRDLLLAFLFLERFE